MRTCAGTRECVRVREGRLCPLVRVSVRAPVSVHVCRCALGVGVGVYQIQGFSTLTWDVDRGALRGVGADKRVGGGGAVGTEGHRGDDGGAHHGDRAGGESTLALVLLRRRSQYRGSQQQARDRSKSGITDLMIDRAGRPVALRDAL